MVKSDGNRSQGGHGLKSAFSDGEIEHMGKTLIAVHGRHAAQQADFFAQEHELSGDTVRARAWYRVLAWLVREGHAAQAVTPVEKIDLVWTVH